jgi:hypothetical protein
MNVWPVLRGATLADEPTAGPEFDRRAKQPAHQRRATERSDGASPLKPVVRPLRMIFGH